MVSEQTLPLSQAPETPTLAPTPDAAALDGTRDRLLAPVGHTLEDLSSAFSTWHDGFRQSVRQAGAHTNDAFQQTLAPVRDRLEHLQTSAAEPLRELRTTVDSTVNTQLRHAVDQAQTTASDLADTLTTLRKLRPEPFRQTVADDLTTAIADHPWLAWAWLHPLWALATIAIAIVLLWGLLATLGDSTRSLWRWIFGRPIVLGRWVREQIWPNDRLADDRAFEALYGARAIRNRRSRGRQTQLRNRLQRLNRERNAVLEELQTFEPNATPTRSRSRKSP